MNDIHALVVGGWGDPQPDLHPLATWEHLGDVQLTAYAHSLWGVGLSRIRHPSTAVERLLLLLCSPAISPACG